MGPRCSECAALRASVSPAYTTCRYQRLCDVVDPVLIGHRKQATLDELRALGQSIERGQFLMAQHVDAVGEWPADAAEFCGLLRTAHLLLLGGALPEIAGRFRAPGEPVWFGGGGRHAREGAPGNRIEGDLATLFHGTRAALFAADDSVRVSIMCAQFLVRFFQIHPFADGNGRLGRSMLGLLCRLGGRFELRWAGGDPAIRRRYITALEYAHRHALDGDRGDGRPHGCPPILLARWIEPQLHRPPAAVEEAEPPELRSGFDD